MKTTIYNYYSGKIVSVHNVLKFASYIHENQRVSLPEALKRARQYKTLTHVLGKDFTESQKTEITRELDGIVSFQFDLTKTSIIHERGRVDYLNILSELKSRLDEKSLNDISTILYGIQQDEIFLSDVRKNSR